MVKPVLFILTSANKLLNGAATGWYLPEAAHPALVLHKAGIPVDFASPAGGEAPLDQVSVENFKDDESVHFLNDKEWQSKYKNTKKLSDIKQDDYSAIFVVGGHGPMIDLAASDSFAKLLEDFYGAKKPVSAVCHGPAALIMAKTPSGDSILKDRKVTGFANSEEAQTPYNDFKNILPFSLEDKLNELSGGKYEKTSDWGSKVIYDGGVLTGQNPASAKELGEKLVELVSA